MTIDEALGTARDTRLLRIGRGALAEVSEIFRSQFGDAGAVVDLAQSGIWLTTRQALYFEMYFPKLSIFESTRKCFTSNGLPPLPGTLFRWASREESADKENDAAPAAPVGTPVRANPDPRATG